MSHDPAAGSPELVTFGEALALFLTEPPRRLRGARAYMRSIAGAGSNVAIEMSRLGRRVGWFGRVGADPLGHAALDALRAESVDLSRAPADVVLTGPEEAEALSGSSGREAAAA